MRRKLHIARDDVEMAALDEAEVHELLREGFLLPSDRYRVEGMQEWEELRKLEAAPGQQSRSGALMDLARESTSVLSQSAVAQVSRFKEGLKSLAKHGKGQLRDSTNRLLEPFIPQIQKLVEHQLVKQSVTRVQAAMRDDEFMGKLFGATYDCLPKPVYRFLKEDAFIQYCMERRGQLLGLEKPEKGTQTSITSQPGSGSDR